MMKYKDYIDSVAELDKNRLTELLSRFTEEDRLYAGEKARRLTEERFGRKIYIRGLIEFTNVCRNDCYYCGIRCSNRKVKRFRLSEEQITECCRKGYDLGFRTFVLQGGEDRFFDDDRLCSIVSRIHEEFPDCALTLSVGERSRESYQRLFNAGADRYLLRHETASESHYARLHPEKMSFAKRMECLEELKAAGYQTGCGMMVGSPFQTTENLAEDLIFMRSFRPEMIGIGPFLPQKETPLGDRPQGSVEMTLFLLSLIRIMMPDVLLPATTALGSAGEDGRIQGILAGANVYMPNLSPEENREKYLLYDKKAALMDDAGFVLKELKSKLEIYGYDIEIGRGDYEENSHIR